MTATNHNELDKIMGEMELDCMGWIVHGRIEHAEWGDKATKSILAWHTQQLKAIKDEVGGKFKHKDLPDINPNHASCVLCWNYGERVVLTTINTVISKYIPQEESK